MFGLGFATCRVTDEATGAATNTIDVMCNSAMLKGGSPTFGLLEFGTKGSETGGLFTWMASSGPDSIGWADVLFMFLAIDVWPEQNPINSSHTIEMAAFLGIATVGPGRLSLQNWMVKTFPFMSWAK